MLDSLAGYVTRNALDTLLPFIFKIINRSLQSGQRPSHLKVVKLRPLLKKPSLDHTHFASATCKFSNYRSVSNLAFISKAIDLISLDGLFSHFKPRGIR